MTTGKNLTKLYANKAQQKININKFAVGSQCATLRDIKANETTEKAT
tara:strand:+ start:4861 stop:5001 length:141 start_codon:yes stop_codon:yes gene_type:complete